jgi:hypothetical protein
MRWSALAVPRIVVASNLEFMVFSFCFFFDYSVFRISGFPVFGNTRFRG